VGRRFRLVASARSAGKKITGAGGADRGSRSLHSPRASLSAPAVAPSALLSHRRPRRALAAARPGPDTGARDSVPLVRRNSGRCHAGEHQGRARARSAPAPRTVSLPAERAEATSRISDHGTVPASMISISVVPTAPVAPTIASTVPISRLSARSPDPDLRRSAAGPECTTASSSPPSRTPGERAHRVVSWSSRHSTEIRISEVFIVSMLIPARDRLSADVARHSRDATDTRADQRHPCPRCRGRNLVEADLARRLLQRGHRGRASDGAT